MLAIDFLLTIFNSSSWSDPIYFDNPGFDQDLFWESPSSASNALESKVYLSTTTRLKDRDPTSTKKDFAIHISEIDLPTGPTLTPPVVIRQSDFGVAEGSHIIRKDDYYYLFVAEGGTEAGHQEWVFRSKEGVLGPWEGQGKALWYNGSEEEVQRTGHADVFEDGEGRWWAVFLGVRPLKVEGKWLEPQLGRETFLVKVDWFDDWPVFNEGKNVTLLTAGRDNLTQNIIQKSAHGVRWRANLSLSPKTDELEIGWYTKHTPLKPFYSLTARPNFIRLWGSCYDLSSPESPSMLLRKQEDYRETFHATLEFQPRREGYEAGIVVWWSEFSHATIGVTAAKGEDGEIVSSIVWRKPSGKAGEMEVTYPFLTHSHPCPVPDTSHVYLTASANDDTYILSLAFASSTGKPSLSSYFSFSSEEVAVMPPVGGAFTGVMWGIYCFGKGEPVLDPADFSGIHITEQR